LNHEDACQLIPSSSPSSSSCSQPAIQPTKSSGPQRQRLSEMTEKYSEYSVTSNIRRRCTAKVSRFLTSIHQEQSTLNVENAAVPQTFYMSNEAAEEMLSSGQDSENELFVGGGCPFDGHCRCRRRWRSG
ncbi:hypothetical protein J4Q44_G00132920, partial [Coregonus suidteri]